MKKWRFTEIEIAGILKEVDVGLPVGDVIRRYGISATTYYKWKSPVQVAERLRVKAHQGVGSSVIGVQADRGGSDLKDKTIKGLIAKKL